MCHLRFYPRHHELENEVRNQGLVVIHLQRSRTAESSLLAHGETRKAQNDPYLSILKGRRPDSALLTYSSCHVEMNQCLERNTLGFPRPVPQMVLWHTISGHAAIRMCMNYTEAAFQKTGRLKADCDTPANGSCMHGAERDSDFRPSGQNRVHYLATKLYGCRLWYTL